MFLTTVHGPVLGYGTVQRQRVAITLDRSTRGRELLNARAFMLLNTNAVRSARSFLRAMSQVEFTFNWFYADDRDIAMFSSGRLPIRNPDVDPRLPMRGTGEDDWRGFMPASKHVQAINPAGGAIVNWNNKPAVDFGAADDNWAYGAVQRVDLLKTGVALHKKHTLATVVSAMSRAATQDIRAVEVVPLIVRVLAEAPAPSARDALMAKELSAWYAAGGSRLDRDLDGKIDDPGAAVLDAAWPRIADAVMRPVLGDFTGRLAAIQQRDDAANPHGSSYFDGWYGYVDKDLRTLLGLPVRAPFHLRYCGGGEIHACAASLWAAIDAAGNELQAAQGPAPTAWRADATRERIRFAGFLPLTMRWANRPTFQQVITFDRHRPR